MTSNDAMETFQSIPMNTWITGGAAAFVVFLALLAFSRGVMKQLMGMVCLGIGVSVAWFCFRHRVEVVGPSAITMDAQRLLAFSAGVGLLAYGVMRAVVHLFGVIGLIGLAGIAGWRGMLLSVIPSGFILWVGAMALRLIGNLYGMETASAVARESTRIESSVGDAVTGMRKALDHSMLGGFMARLDPFSMRATANLARLLIIWPEKRIWNQMVLNPRINRIYSHPKILELGMNPKVRKCIDTKDFAGLMQLPEVEHAAAHPELKPLLSDVALEDAMDTVLYGRVPNKKR